MRIVRGLGLALAGIVVLLFAVGFAARLADGPIGPFPGGPLRSGELVRSAEPDWAFVRDVAEIELQLVEPPRSRTVWVIEHEGRIYVPCGYLDVPFFKKWPYQALEDGRAVVRIEGRRFERKLVRIDEPALRAVLARKNQAKYQYGGDASAPPTDSLWFFRLDPR